MHASGRHLEGAAFLHDEFEVFARLAVSGEHLASVRARPEDTVRSLRLAFKDALEKDGGADFVLRVLSSGHCCGDGADGLLPDTATLTALGLGHGSVVDVVRCRCVLATASNDTTARLWSPDTGECLATLVGHFGQVYAAVLSSDGRMVVTASEDGTARLWSTDSGECLQMLTGHSGEVYSAVFSPDSRSLVTASEDHDARVWSVATGECSWTLAGHTGEVFLATFSPDDGRLILTASEDGTARLWSCVAGSASRQLRVLHAGHEPEARRRHGRPRRRPPRGVEQSCEVLRAEFSPDGRHVVAAAGCVGKVWDAFCLSVGCAAGEDEARCVCALRGHVGQIKYAAFSPDSQTVVTTSDDTTARLWNVPSGVCCLMLAGHGDIVYMAHFSPDSRRLVTASEDFTARLWSVDSGGRESADDSDVRQAVEPLVGTLVGHAEAVGWAEFSADGESLVTSSWDGTARIWSGRTGACMEVLEGHAGPVVFACFSS